MTNHRLGLSVLFVPIAALCLACQSGPLSDVHAAKGQPIALSQLESTPWIATEIAGEKPLATDGGRHRPSLVFQSEKKVVGSTGCNEFTAPISGVSNPISIGPFATTRKQCPEAIMDQERRYLKALAEGRHFERAMRILYLLDANGTTTVRFRRAE